MSTKPSSMSTNEELDARLMPPPPDPVPKESKILQPEFEALGSCLKEIILKTGQIYNFYADTHRLGIQHQAPYPPRTLTGALGREIEKYDQVCDSIASSINRAITVLKRELAAEQEKKRQEEEAEAQRQKAELEKMAATAPSSPVMSAETLYPGSEADLSTPLKTPHQLPVRRQSAISFSSLQRPAFPLKLDLSSPSLRLSEDDASLFSKEPASPVTLAPKSARPVDTHEFPADFMAAFAASSVPPDMMHPPELDLSAMHLPQKQSQMLGSVGLGDSSDKPIELDLEGMDMEMTDMNELFGEHPDSAASSNPLFSPQTAEGPGQKGNDPQIAKVDDLNLNPELFGEFTTNPELAAGLLPQENASVPSPETLMAQLASSQFMGLKESTSTEGTENFNLNLDISHLTSGIFNNGHETGIGFPMDMDSFMAMDGSIEEKVSQEPSASHPQ
ncbi:hypothetical protein CVT24_003511 [Panaeolus cyanescens]|uniref:Uncharacterized protein n=1 Tax=Panaeolus cyanescens TaxID=181874 RepID=A0A409Y7A4_9AGAR|nr:hypothetical protein CVT24_003511 [Panaeolus cyanescens]